MARCCCGRVKDWTEPIIIDDIQHERLNDPRAFCGPWRHHAIRDLTAENERLWTILKNASDLSRQRRWPLVQCELERAIKEMGK